MHFQSHSILTQDIQYAVQMKALAMGSEHVGGSAAVILNSQCIMHLTVSLCCVRTERLSPRNLNVAHLCFIELQEQTIPVAQLSLNRW